MKKFTIRIEGKEYALDLQDDFADYMEKEIERSLAPHSNNSAKDLLSAYLKKCFECFEAEKKARDLLKKI